MGLDMYAWRVAAEDAINDFEIADDASDISKVEEIFYWRKHYDLHAIIRHSSGQVGIYFDH